MSAYAPAQHRYMVSLRSLAARLSSGLETRRWTSSLNRPSVGAAAMSGSAWFSHQSLNCSVVSAAARAALARSVRVQIGHPPDGGRRSAHEAHRHQLLQPVPDPFAMPGHRRVLTQHGHHLPAPHRPAGFGKHRQQPSREVSHRIRTRRRRHRLLRHGDQPGQHLPRDGEAFDLPPTFLDQPRDLRDLLLQPQPLDPSRRFPLGQQQQDLIAIHPPAHPHREPVNQPIPTGCRKPQPTDIDARRAAHSGRNAPARRRRHD